MSELKLSPKQICIDNFINSNKGIPPHEYVIFDIGEYSCSYEYFKQRAAELGWSKNKLDNAVKKYNGVWPKGTKSLITTGPDWDGDINMIGDILPHLPGAYVMGNDSWIVLCTREQFEARAADLGFKRHKSGGYVTSLDHINCRCVITPLPTGNKYHRQITGLDGMVTTVDVYRVLHAFPSGMPEIDHAVKKLLAPGQRGVKDRITDLREAAQSIECAIKYLEQHSD